MSQLTKGCYGNEFSGKVGRFGLRCGQMRAMKGEIGNAGWYNKKGEKMGFGDLDLNDMRHIADGLEQDECFIVLSEQDSFWNFVEFVGTIGAGSSVKPDEQQPPLAYIAAKARFVILPGQVSFVSDRPGRCYPGATAAERMEREALAVLLGVEKESLFQKLRDWL